MQVVPAVLATLCFVSSVAAADFEFAHIIEADRYDRPIVRPGNPKIIRANTSTGLLVETEMGVYRATSAEPTVIASGEYALPEGAKVRFGHGIRLYGFGGVGGTLTTALGAKGKNLTFSVSGAPSAETLLCRVDGPGMDGLEFSVPVKSLPADFTFYLTDRGDFDWVVTGLADSSEIVKKGKSSVFDGFWIDGYGYPPLKVETTFVRAGAAGAAEVTVDNRLIGDCTTAEKLDVPAVLSPAPSFDPVKEGWPLVFSDEFDGEEVDWSKWYFAPKAGNPDRNDFCRPDGRGVLNLKCDYAAGSTNLMTGSMRSKREFTYGYFESRFKLTRQNGWWAAVWMYGRLNSDPFVDGIEIDIFEDYYTRKKDLQGRNRRQLDHNLHLYLGTQLKSWNFSDDYDGSIDDWIVLGCKRTPFEISYYLNGKLIRSSANHCNWTSVTFDAFNHCAATVPLHVIVSGQVMGPSWPWFDKTDATFPECFQVDYVRCYEMPCDPEKLPSVAWTGESAKDNGSIAFFSPGDKFRFDVTASPAAKGGAPVKAVYLFDAGSLIGFRTEPPYAFDVEMTPAWYAKTRYLKPGRQNVVPDFSKAPHSFVAFVQDADGNVAHTSPIRRHPKFLDPRTRPFEGRAQTLPGSLVLWRYDEGGQGVAYLDTTKGNTYAKSGKRPEGDVDCTGGELAHLMPGEWVNYTVDVAEAGLYRVEARYGTGIPGPHRIHLVVDGASVGSLDCAYAGDGTAWTPDKMSLTEVRLPKGRHVLSLCFHAQLNLAKLSFVRCTPIRAEGAELPTAMLDPGGVTFDFKALSDARFRIPSPGDKENLVDGTPWEGNSYCQIHHVKVPGSSPLLKEAKKAASWMQKDGVCSVAKSPDLVRLVGEEYAKVTSGAFTKVVRLPDGKGGNYRVSFRYRSRHSLGPDYGYLLVYFKNWDAAKRRWTKAEGVKGNNGEYFAWVFKDAGDWNVWTKDFTLPAGCEALEFVMRTDGVGDLSFKDFGLVSAKADTSAVTLALNPHGALGGDFAIGRGQCGGVGVTWKRNAADVIDVPKCRFALTLPKGYAYLGDTFGATSDVSRTVLPDGSSEVTFAARRGLSLTQKFETWNRMLILVRAEKDAEDGEAALAVRCEGKSLAHPLRFTLRAVEPVTATKPKRFRNGVFTAGTSTRFGAHEANAAFAELMGACGVDWLVYYTGYYPQADRDFIPLWRKAGIRYLTPSTAFANGYYLTQRWAKMPKEDAFIGTHGDGHSTGTTWDQYMDRAMCPLAIVEERSFFRDVVKEELVRQLAGTDGMWGNWEPFMFRGRGCNCAKCKAAYETWRKKTGGSVSDFRSMLHGKVVETVDRHVKRLTGGTDSLGFIPGISWREMCSTWDEKKAAPEAKAVDYAGGLKWIDPWGPYVYWDSSSSYLYQKRGPLAHFVAARDIREQVDRDYRPGARPKLMSFPQGEQSGGWVTEPEWLEMAMDSFFFNRWDANVVYFFPQGYDARYWRAFARATTRVAKYEDFVLDGTPADAKVELAPVREYAVPSGYVSTYLPKYGDVPLLQSAAFDRDGVRIVAAFNFWDRGEAFFTLKAEMPEGRYAVVDEDGVRYAKGLSAADLRRGVPLAVGAARTKVFEIVPSGKAGVAVPTRDAQVGAHYAARRPALAAAAAEDARIEALNKITTDTKGEL